MEFHLVGPLVHIPYGSMSFAPLIRIIIICSWQMTNNLPVVQGTIMYGSFSSFRPLKCDTVGSCANRWEWKPFPNQKSIAIASRAHWFLSTYEDHIGQNKIRSFTNPFPTWYQSTLRLDHRGGEGAWQKFTPSHKERARTSSTTRWEELLL